MDTPKIFESEYRFCLILWEHEPINSTRLAALCKEKLGVKEVFIGYTGAVIGSHSGPGTLALFFLGKQR